MFFCGNSDFSLIIQLMNGQLSVPDPFGVSGTAISTINVTVNNFWALWNAINNCRCWWKWRSTILTASVSNNADLIREVQQKVYGQKAEDQGTRKPNCFYFQMNRDSDDDKFIIALKQSSLCLFASDEVWSHYTALWDEWMPLVALIISLYPSTFASYMVNSLLFSDW